MKKAPAYKIREQTLRVLHMIWTEAGGGDRDYFVAQQVWDSVRARFPEGSISGGQAERVFGSLQSDGSIELVPDEAGGHVGIRLTEAGRTRFEENKRVRRNTWLGYIGAVTGLLGLTISVLTEFL
jgi:hypothetical protein